MEEFDNEYEIILLRSQNEKLRKLLIDERFKVYQERKRRILLEARLLLIFKTLKDVYNVDVRDLITSEGSVSTNGNSPSDFSQTINRFSNAFQTENSYGSKSASAMTVDLSYSSQLLPPDNDKRILNTTQSLQVDNEVNQSKSSNTPWLWFVDENGISTAQMPLSLSNALKMRKAAFIARSAARQKRINAARAFRKHLAHEKHKIALEVLAGRTDVRNVADILGHSCCFLPRSSFYQSALETKQRIQGTKESEDQRRAAVKEKDFHVNRLLAYCYSQTVRNVQ